MSGQEYNWRTSRDGRAHHIDRNGARKAALGWNMYLEATGSAVRMRVYEDQDSAFISHGLQKFQDGLLFVRLLVVFGPVTIVLEVHGDEKELY